MNNEEKIIAYLLGEMDPSQRTVFEQDLHSSKKLRVELEEYKKLIGTIREIEAAELPEQSSHRFNSMLDAEIKALESKQNKVVAMRPNYFKMISIAVSFALIGLFVGYQLQNKEVTQLANIQLSEAQKNEFIQLVGQGRTSKKIHGLELLDDVSTLDEEVVSTLEDVLFNDPSTNVRLAVIDALKEHIDQEDIKAIMIRGLKYIEKPMVKIGLIQALSNTQSKQYLPNLEEALQHDDLDKAVRDELHVGIMKLSKNT